MVDFDWFHYLEMSNFVGSYLLSLEEQHHYIIVYPFKLAWPFKVYILEI